MLYAQLIKNEQDLFIKEGHKYAELVRRARKVHKELVVPLWNLKVIRNDGTVRVDRYSYAHSFTRNLFVAHTVFSLFRGFGGTTHNSPVSSAYGDGALGLNDITDSVKAGFRVDAFVEPNVFGGGYGIPAADLSYGFQAGTGTTGEDFEDFVIEGLISQGDGVGGTMDYKIAVLTKGWNGASRYKFAQWERSLENKSGGTITVGNVAMYFRTINATLCFVREVLSPAEDILDTETLSFTYEFRMFFP